MTDPVAGQPGGDLRADQSDTHARDRAAVEAVRAGDADAFGGIVTRYQRRLFGLALMMTRNPEGAEEIAQDAFVHAYTKLGLYDVGRPFYPWLATIAVRLAQNWLRGHTRVTAREGTPIDETHEAPPAGADAGRLESLIADERDRRLWRAVAALPSGQRTAVLLHYRQDMKVREVAHALGVTSGTVKTLLFRARQRLRGTLEVSQALPPNEGQPT